MNSGQFERGLKLPGLAKGANFGVERPSGARLMRNAEAMLGNVCRLAEKVIRFVGKALARPFKVNDGVNGDKCHVYPVWTQPSSHGF